MSGKVTHESAVKHVTGEALFIDDIQTDNRLLTGYIVYSSHAHARIKQIDISKAAVMPGIFCILTAKDIPGKNQVGPVKKDEPCLAEKEVDFIGQAVCLIAGENEATCIEAARNIKIDYQLLAPILNIEQARKNKKWLDVRQQISRGDLSEGFRKSQMSIKGELKTGAQEHWYLETQVCLCMPGEDDEMAVFSSTQHPSETQALVADVLGIKRHNVVVEVRRMGGAFGGKETQANHTACWTALLSKATGHPVKIRLFRDDDQIMTGKRHPFHILYEVGFNKNGVLNAGKFELYSDGGAALDLSAAIMERAMFHIDNAYYIPNLSVKGRICQTNHPPNTALRGFGAPQAMAAIETVIDRIARLLGTDAAQIRKRNFYGQKNRNITHYGQKIEHNHLGVLYDRLIKSSSYDLRRQKIHRFNQTHDYIKRGLALTPVKFGISFTTSFLNQAGALIHVYQDGTVLINHGGAEMGQGLHTKIIQIASAELGLSIDKIKINATNTSKVANTSATAASSGTDLNGMAVKDAIDQLKKKIRFVVAAHYSKNKNKSSILPQHLRFERDQLISATDPKFRLPFAQAVKLVYLSRTSLTANGYYRTPRINWDKKLGRGRPFNYFAFGMAVSEVELDLLTGFHQILRTDILHDAGNSINSQLDIGQIHGGFIQGVGWCTTEEIKWDSKGNLLNYSPDTYKIPAITDIPLDFRVELLKGYPNPNAIRKSKAIGEPPLMLCFSVWLAIKDAISAIANHTIEPLFFLPATNEKILLAIDDLRKKMKINQKI